MILVDTNIIIDYLRGNDSELTSLIETDDLAICGIVLAELLHGVNSETDKDILYNALSDFEWISIDDSIWRTVGDNLYLLRKRGVSVPFQDVVLASLCVEKGVLLATKDRHFDLIAEHLPDFNIYH